MENQQYMPLSERIKIGIQAQEHLERGEVDEYNRLYHSKPIEPETAIIITMLYGKEALSNYNISVAMEENEPGWIEKYDGMFKTTSISGSPEEMEAKINALLNRI